MTDPGVSVDVGPPPAFDIVPADAARALMDDVRAAITTLERELEEAVREADDAEVQAAKAPPLADAVTAVRDDLRRMADWLRAEAATYAAEVREHARSRATALVDAAQRGSVDERSDDATPTLAPLLRLAPPVDRTVV